MTKIIVYIAIAFLATIGKTQAQKTDYKTKNDGFMRLIAVNKTIEKENLKNEIEKIDDLLDTKKITEAEASTQRKNAAQKSADQIAFYTNKYMDSINFYVEKEIDEKIIIKEEEVKKGKSVISYYDKDGEFFPTETLIGTIKLDSTKNSDYSVKNIEFYDKKERKNQRKSRRTQSQVVFAAGVNNVLTDGNLAQSKFRFWGSHFYEFGTTWRTRIFKNNNLYHIKYGVGFVWNNLRPTDNKYFNYNGNQTNLVTSSIPLDDSRFTTVTTILPIHLELDFSKDTEYQGKKYFQTHKGLRIGFGGFIGNTGVVRQELIFNDVNGNETTQNTKGGYNVSTFSYGLSTYIGYGSRSLYLKYNLNPLFENNPIKQNNISLGLRWDWN